MTSPATITLEELSSLTGKPAQWWRRNWLRMHERHFFPRRLPGLWAWPRSTVEAWVRHGGFTPMAPVPANSNEPVTDLAAATALLEQRFGIVRGA